MYLSDVTLAHPAARRSRGLHLEAEAEPGAVFLPLTVIWLGLDCLWERALMGIPLGIETSQKLLALPLGMLKYDHSVPT